eukprot:gene5489-8915_t
MSMLWRAVETLLLIEVVFVLLLCIPSPAWRQVVVRMLPLFRQPSVRKAVIACQALCAILFFDATNGILRSQSHQFFADSPDSMQEKAPYNLMRKFRTERNAHISGFCLLLLFLINRMALSVQEFEDTRKKLSEKTEQVRLLSDQLEARAAATAEERAAHRQHHSSQHTSPTTTGDSNSLRQRRQQETS